MASGSGASHSQHVSIEEIIRIIQSEETDPEGMPSDEESDLDRELYNMDKNPR